MAVYILWLVYYLVLAGALVHTAIDLLQAEARVST
jgi:hypothetical protein